MKAIVALDSFKGCLTSAQAGQAALSVLDEGSVMVPVSDGGEGFSKIITDLLNGELCTATVSDPLGRRIEAAYGLVRNGRTAVIETASASGLGRLAPEERNPLAASSYGTGELMVAALDEGVEEIWLGLGGSATCDGGTGLLQALGYRFLTPGGVLEPRRTVLGNIQGIDSTHRHHQLQDCRITGFYDVSVPFFGLGGAVRMFAPQKGAGPEMVDALDSWMAQLCSGYSAFSGREIRHIPGSGAAGGIGGALRAFLGATMNPGIGHLLDLAGMGRTLDTCKFVITGEGHADAQTLRGKVPMGVLNYVRDYDAACGGVRHTRVVLLAGRVTDRERLEKAGFDAVLSITPPQMPLTEALDPETAATNLRTAIARFQETFSSGTDSQT